MTKALPLILALTTMPSLALAQDAATEPAEETTTASEPKATSTETAPTAKADKKKPASPAAEDEEKDEKKEETSVSPAAATPTVEAKPGEKKETKKEELTAVASALTPEQLAAFSGFIHNLSLDHSVGSGTFVDASKFADVGATLGLSTRYSFRAFDTSLAATGGTSFSYEYSLPNNINGRRFQWSDIRLGLTAPALIREKTTKINVTPSLGASIPLTFGSIHASTITTLSANLNAMRSFGGLQVRLGLGGSRGLHFNPANVVSPSDTRDAQGRLIYICRTAESFCGSAGMNTAWSASTSLSTAYGITDLLWVGGGINAVKTWAYAVTDEVDEFTPKAVDSNGNPVARTGMGQSDFMTGFVWASYALNNKFSLGGSIGTSSPPKTADNRNFRFPFFDLVSPANNFTQFSLSLSAQL